MGDHWQSLLIGIPVAFAVCLTLFILYIWLWQSQKVQRKEQLEGTTKAAPKITAFSGSCDKYQFMTMSAHITSVFLFGLVNLPGLIDDNHDDLFWVIVPVYVIAEIIVLAAWIRISTRSPFEEKLEGNVCDRAYCKHCKGSYKGVHRRHCMYCNRCTTGYDHHCFFLNICVCRDNYKCFLVLVAAAFAVNGLQTGIPVFQITRSFANEEVPGHADEWYTRATFETFCSLQLLISASSFVLLAVLLSLHTYLVCIGITTHQFLGRRYQEEIPLAIKLPEGWAKQCDPKGEEYFFNTSLALSQWTIPKGSGWEHTKDTVLMEGVDFGMDDCTGVDVELKDLDDRSPSAEGHANAINIDVEDPDDVKAGETGIALNDCLSPSSGRAAEVSSDMG